MLDALTEKGNRPGVLLLSTSFLIVSRLRFAITRERSLACHCASSVAHAHALLARERLVALVLEPEDARGEATATLARLSRAAAPSRPVVALVRRAAGWTPNALALIAAQPEMIVVAEELDTVAVLRAIAPPLRAGDLVDDVWPRLEADVPLALRPIVRLALARAAAPLPVTELALALGLHRKTLWMQCRRHGVASVQALLMWCRLIAVGHALRTRTQSVEWIANEMEFASPTSLRNATRRYLGVTPTALREAGGEELACRAFRRWLRGSVDAESALDVPIRTRTGVDARHGVTTGDAA